MLSSNESCLAFLACSARDGVPCYSTDLHNVDINWRFEESMASPGSGLEQAM